VSRLPEPHLLARGIAVSFHDRDGFQTIEAVVPRAGLTVLTEQDGSTSLLGEGGILTERCDDPNYYNSWKLRYQLRNTPAISQSPQDADSDVSRFFRQRDSMWREMMGRQ
jgi:hypothetical protein